jgi:hypothetical protein
MAYVVKNRKTEQVNEYADEAGVEGFFNSLNPDERRDWSVVAQAPQEAGDE